MIENRIIYRQKECFASDVIIVIYKNSENVYVSGSKKNKYSINNRQLIN